MYVLELLVVIMNRDQLDGCPSILLHGVLNVGLLNKYEELCGDVLPDAAGKKNYYERHDMATNHQGF